MKTDRQADVISFLADPASHGGAPVQRIDTHAAIVFLAGDRAFKMKRAVTFSYLDFATADARRAACEAEVRLNRRTAPELYLGVRSVNRQADGRPGFGAGEPIEWLVEMRRFPADALLEDVAARGELTPALVRALADEIARFHDMAEIARIESGAAHIAEVIESNRRSLIDAAGDMLAMADIQLWHRRILAALARVADLLDRRAAAGFVRHCHGDLHLRNICLLDGRPRLFDCLEFDAGLATIDTLYDLAFLLMDLWMRGLRAEASAVLNRYCDRSAMDMAGGLAAMPLFLSLRAAIRAHASASAAEVQTDAAKQQQEREQARQYLSMAADLLQPAPIRLIAIGGLSGTGKSTLAQRLAPFIGAPPGARVLRSDVIRKRLADAAPEQRLPPESYTRESSAAVYRQMYEQTAALLAGGVSVIADGVFADQAERRAIAAVDASFAGLWLTAPPALLRQRVTDRRNDASDATAAVIDRQLQYDVGPLDAWQTIESGDGADMVLARARQILSV